MELQFRYEGHSAHKLRTVAHRRRPWVSEIRDLDPLFLLQAPAPRLLLAQAQCDFLQVLHIKRLLIKNQPLRLVLNPRDRISALCDLCFPEALIQAQVNTAPLMRVVSEKLSSWPSEPASQQRRREGKSGMPPKGS